MADRVPTLIQRVHAQRLERITVLEPYRTESRIQSVMASDKGEVVVTLKGGQRLTAALDALIRQYAWKAP